MICHTLKRRGAATALCVYCGTAAATTPCTIFLCVVEGPVVWLML